MVAPSMNLVPRPTILCAVASTMIGKAPGSICLSHCFQKWGFCMRMTMQTANNALFNHHVVCVLNWWIVSLALSFPVISADRRFQNRSGGGWLQVAFAPTPSFRVALCLWSVVESISRVSSTWPIGMAPWRSLLVSIWRHPSGRLGCGDGGWNVLWKGSCQSWVGVTRPDCSVHLEAFRETFGI